MCENAQNPLDVVGVFDENTFGPEPDYLAEIRESALSNSEILELIKAACALSSTGRSDTLQNRLLQVFGLYMKVRKA